MGFVVFPLTRKSPPAGKGERTLTVVVVISELPNVLITIDKSVRTLTVAFAALVLSKV